MRQASRFVQMLRHVAELGQFNAFIRRRRAPGMSRSLSRILPKHSRLPVHAGGFFLGLNI
jgi:hypothetical protein